jgi:hypothetical protein
MKRVVFAAFAVAAVAASASAQQVSSYIFVDKSAGESQQVLLDKVRVEQGLKVALETKAVPNAPYTAETINESVQVLPDGNRIVHKTTARVYRDSAGRTRRETLDDNGQVTVVAIHDPSTGVSYILDTRNNSVSQSKVRLSHTSGEGPTTATATTTTDASGPVTLSFSVSDKQHAEMAASTGHVIVREGVAGGVTGGVAGGTYVHATSETAKSDVVKEDLGEQTIEGVKATGKRTTTTIPAGAVGNEQPIKIVSEEWFAPELQVLVLTRYSDPRTGETTYRLTGISRTEPAKALFEAPTGK